jgi:hypothetical protein
MCSTPCFGPRRINLLLSTYNTENITCAVLGPSGEEPERALGRWQHCQLDVRTVAIMFNNSADFTVALRWCALTS